MSDVICVRFRTAGKIYYFDPGDLEIKRGMNVIVETARGKEYGRVVSDIKQVDEESLKSPLKPVIRIATEEDADRETVNRLKEKDAFKICKERIAAHGLEMKLIDAEYTFDGSKLLFYFTADGRVDFRELVKDLAGQFRTRIELRQIGARDKAEQVGGIGMCGRELCCSGFLKNKESVTINMAKNQNIASVWPRNRTCPLILPRYQESAAGLCAA